MKNRVSLDILNENNEEVEASSAWLTTFADLFTLLFAFFVMIAGSSSPDQEKYDEIRKSISKALSNTESTALIERLNNEEGCRQGLLEKLTKSLKEDGIDDVATLEVNPRGILLTLPPDILFQRGSVSLNEKAKDELLHIINILNGDEYLEYKLEVRGHTDYLLISTVQYPSNWELSAARAASVMNYMINNGLKSKSKRVVGFANSRPIIKIVKGMTDKERANARQVNRRIEMLISYQKEEKWLD